MSRAILTIAMVAAAEGYSAPSSILPTEVTQYLERSLPSFIKAMEHDDALLKEVGAHSASELRAAALDYGRAVRVHHLDPKALPKAPELQRALVPTDQYCMPFCLNGGCKALMCLRYDETEKRTSLMSVGRAAEARRLIDGLHRVARIYPKATRPKSLVLLGSREFLHVRAETGTAEYLAPISDDAAAHGAARGLMTLAGVKSMVASLPEMPSFAATPRTLLAGDDRLVAEPVTDGADAGIIAVANDSNILDESTALAASPSGDTLRASPHRGIVAMMQRGFLLLVGLLLLAIRLRRRATA